jgi:hypothetical protein
MVQPPPHKYMLAQWTQQKRKKQSIGIYSLILSLLVLQPASSNLTWLVSIKRKQESHSVSSSFLIHDSTMFLDIYNKLQPNVVGRARTNEFNSVDWCITIDDCCLEIVRLVTTR